MTTDELLEVLRKRELRPRKSGQAWKSICPAHADKNPSLDITEGRDGRTLVICRTGCSTESICTALDLKLGDLFPDGPAQRNGKGTLVKAYDYRDAGGKLLFQVCRFDPKDFRQRQPDSNGGWRWKMDGVQKVLYRLPGVIKAIRQGHPVIVTEGEKDADALAERGFAATTHAGGADNGTGSKWLPRYADTLTGADVVIVADKDKAGRIHANFVAQSLSGKAKSVRVLELPDLNGRTVKDAHDWFTAGGQAGDLLCEMEATPFWSRESGLESGSAEATGDREISDLDQEPSTILLPEIDNAASLIADESIVLPPEIIEGLLHQGLKAVLGSNSKARKTWILLDVGMSVATGSLFWGKKTIKGPVLYINFEIPRSFMRSRIKKLCEAKGIQDINDFDVWTLRGHGAALGRLLPSLLAKIESGKYALIIIDPVYKVLGGRDENAAGDISELCNELERMAVATGAAVLFAAHFSKGNQAAKEAMDRIGGSGVFGRDPDTIITLTKHKTEGAYTVDVTLRNLPEHPPFVVEWDFPLMRLAVELDPQDLKKKGGRKSEFSADELLEVLPPAGLATVEWLKAAKEEKGIKDRTFYNLRKELEQAGRIIQSKATKTWQPVTKNP